DGMDSETCCQVNNFKSSPVCCELKNTDRILDPRFGLNLKSIGRGPPMHPSVLRGSQVSSREVSESKYVKVPGERSSARCLRALPAVSSSSMVPFEVDPSSLGTSEKVVKKSLLTFKRRIRGLRLA